MKRLPLKIPTVIKQIGGGLALALGAIGLFLPIWPTTPFVLLALACFSTTPQIQQRILRIKFFREYYESYTQGRGLCHRTLGVSLGFLWIMLLVSALLVRTAAVTLILLAVGLAVTIHIVWIARPRAQRGRPLREQPQEQE